MARRDDFIGLKERQSRDLQGSSASPEGAPSCPSAEGSQCCSRAGSHFLYAGLSVSPRAESTNLLIKAQFPDIFLDCEFSVALCQTTLLWLSLILCQQVHLGTQKPIHPLLRLSLFLSVCMSMCIVCVLMCTCA